MQTFSHYFIPRFTSFHLLEEENSKNKNLNEYFEKMIKNEARNLMIVSDIKKSVENGRTPLVLSDRLEHLEILKEKLTGCAENVILITGRGAQKQKKQQLEELNSVPSAEPLIVLATGKYVGEGFDNRVLTRLCLPCRSAGKAFCLSIADGFTEILKARMKFRFLTMLIFLFLFLTECIRIDLKVTDRWIIQ